MYQASLEKPGQYAFYGTLRKGMENFAAFANDLEFVDLKVLSGFQMYALPDYPYVVETKNPDHTIVTELFRVKNLETEQSIIDLEFDAGYILSMLALAEGKFGIFVFPEVSTHNLLIADGDWLNYRQSIGF